jgi:hypothetical protein
MSDSESTAGRPNYRIIHGRKVYDSYPKQPVEPAPEDKLDLQLLVERFDRFEELLKSLFKMWQERQREEILQHELASHLDYLYS